jgi:hypothetical protein
MNWLSMKNKSSSLTAIIEKDCIKSISFTNTSSEDPAA